MSMRWQVRGLPLEFFNQDGGSVGEPFGLMKDTTGGTLILTKEQVFYEGDEQQSSQHEQNQQLGRERG